MVKKEDFLGRSLISINDFSKEEIDYVLDYAEKIEKNFNRYKGRMAGKIMAPLFFEPSTRTDCSFQMAMLHMNGKVLDFDPSMSSLAGKGERFKDTILSIASYRPDVFVIRHKNEGFQRAIVNRVDKPVINAGDGTHEHPTQTILDLYAIKKVRGQIDGTIMGLAGDLKYSRVAQSLCKKLADYNGIGLVLISHELLRMPKETLNYLDERGVSYEERDLSELEKSLKDLDILEMLRIQRERFPEGVEGEQMYKEVSSIHYLNSKMLKNAKPNLKVFHPLPRVGEIDLDVDDSKHAFYFSQLEGGLYTRMGSLDLLVGGKSG